MVGSLVVPEPTDESRERHGSAHVERERGHHDALLVGPEMYRSAVQAQRHRPEYEDFHQRVLLRWFVHFR
jgi:hypothetical protein